MSRHECHRDPHLSLGKSWWTKIAEKVCYAILLLYGDVLGATSPIEVNHPDVVWLTGSALDRQVLLPVGIRWSRRELREGLMSLSTNIASPKRLAIVIDRRIDPNQLMNLTIRDVPLAKALSQIAQHLGLGLTRVGPIFYFGPPSITHRLRTVRALCQEQIKTLPKARQDVFNHRQAISWQSLTTPRQILHHLAGHAGIQIDGIEQLPHDLWPNAELPPITLTDRLLLVTVPFNQTFQVADNGHRVTLKTMAQQPILERRYARKNRGSFERKIAAEVPNAQVEVQPNWLVIRGLLEDHEQVEVLLEGQTREVRRRKSDKRPSNKKLAYTLSIENKPVGWVIQQMARELDLHLHFDTAAIERENLSLQTLVSFQVRQATVPQLLSAALQPAHLTFHTQEGTIVVTPANTR